MDKIEDETSLFNESRLQSWDVVVIVVYFVTVLAVGVWSSRKSRKESEDNNDQIGGYFLASRSMHFFPVGASLFASNIGSEHFIGLAGSGAASGLAIGNYEVNAIFILVLLGWLFVPVYLSSGIYTMPEYLKVRFGGQRIRMLLSCLALIAYVFTKISADLYAGALFIKLSVGLDGLGGLYLSILIILAMAAFFTIFGGLSAVIWTDSIQAVLMIGGALMLMFTAIAEVGGFWKVFDKYATAEADAAHSSYYLDKSTGANKSCGSVREDFAHMFRAPGTGDLPWTGTFTGMFINSIWYWCADQVIVQRTLASKNISHAKGGCLLAAYLKLLPLFMLVIPGMAARVLWPNLIACSSPAKCQSICGSTSGCTNISYVMLVLELLPTGLRGLMLAVMLAALMSSLTSVFNSASTIFTMDIWKFFRSRASDAELIVVGRFSVLLLVSISVVWIPFILGFKSPQLFVYIQAVSSYIQPPVTAVFLLALLWPGVTEPAAFWGMIFGFLLGSVRMFLEFYYSVPPCGSPLKDPRPEWVKVSVGQFHYLHFGAMAFVLTLIVVALLSRLSEPFKESQLHRLTFWSRFDTEVRQPIDLEETLATEASSQTGEKTWLQSFIYKICLASSGEEGVSDSSIREPITEEQKARDSVMLLYEEVKYQRLVNGFAIFVMSSAAFVWGYFA